MAALASPPWTIVSAHWRLSLAYFVLTMGFLGMAMSVEVHAGFIRVPDEKKSFENVEAGDPREVSAQADRKKAAEAISRATSKHRSVKAVYLGLTVAPDDQIVAAIIAEFREAIRLNPRESQYHVDFAKFLEDARNSVVLYVAHEPTRDLPNFSESILVEYLEALRLDPSRTDASKAAADIYCHRASFSAENADWVEALAAYNESERLNADRFNESFNICRQHWAETPAQTDDWVGAEAQAKKNLTEYAFDKPVAYSVLGFALASRGDIAGGLAAVDKACSLGKSTDAVFYKVRFYEGRVFAKAGRNTEAIQAYRRALDLMANRARMNWYVSQAKAAIQDLERSRE